MLFPRSAAVRRCGGAAVRRCGGAAASRPGRGGPLGGRGQGRLILLIASRGGEGLTGAHPSTPSGSGQDGEENPAALAESCFRELLGRAAYGNMNNAVRPVLVHLDNHRLWDPNEFAVSCFRIIMYSIQAQHSHHVIQQVLGHLDTHNKNTPRVRAGIVQVLLETVAIAAKGSVGPTVLEVFNTLLKHLRLSVDFELGESSRRNSASSVSSGRAKESEERIVQNAIIQTI
uniref:protein EFR3 homolog A-like n=1 Tax=Centroberyx gerrardi TaxID=166262 RepID=UPI003AAB5C98